MDNRILGSDLESLQDDVPFATFSVEETHTGSDACGLTCFAGAIKLCVAYDTKEPQQLIKGDLFELYQFLTCDRDDMSDISFECSECGEVCPVEACSNFGVVFMFGDLQERHRCSIGF